MIAHAKISFDFILDIRKYTHTQQIYSSDPKIVMPSGSSRRLSRSVFSCQKFIQNWDFYLKYFTSQPEIKVIW